MIRRIVTTLTLVVIGLLSVPAFASAAAPPYPAPPVDPDGTVVAVADPVIAVADPAIAADPSSAASLAVTGAGFSVGTAVAIGVAVLIVGMFLVLAGTRLRKTSNR